MMEANDPVGTVQRMFTAFRAGDIDAVLDTVHPDTRWTYVGANPKPTKAELVGKAGVRRFFEGILRRLEVSTFEATEFVADGNTVVMFGEESGTVKATGEPFRNEWCQQYVVDRNQITRMLEYNIQVEPR
jgi:ketosteroid isomerase-like protein